MISFTSSQNTIIQKVQNAGATLVAVSKTHPVERIRELYDLGIRDFGENKVQELCSKAAVLPSDIRWHLIGHLQTNKVKSVLPYVHLIHSVDSLKLLREIDKEACKSGKQVRFLFQFHIAREESKFGIDQQELEWILDPMLTRELTHVIPCGVMGMATNTDEQEVIREEFLHLKAIFEELKSTAFATIPQFREISMGMSSDYEIALECGSTIVRVGSLLFGNRT